MSSPRPAVSDDAKRSVLLEVAYDGAGYSGVAVQQNARTVGGVLLEGIHHFDSEVGPLRIASRTDAGVHARNQKIAFDTCTRLPAQAWVLGLAQRLPRDIVVRRASFLEAGFNPRFDAAGKHYRYLLLAERLADPFLVSRAWRVHGLASRDVLPALRQELALAEGTHDFKAFASSRDQRILTVRTMDSLTATPLSECPQLVAIDIEGDHFLHNMVRILVGTAVDVARGRLAPGAIRRALQSGQRCDAGVTAPATGLYLEEVKLKQQGSEAWPRRR